MKGKSTRLRAPDLRQPNIKVTKQDSRDINSLFSINASQLGWRSVEYLLRQLARAAIVDEGCIPANVVIIGSRVDYREVGRESTQIVTLCPRAAWHRDIPLTGQSVRDGRSADFTIGGDADVRIWHQADSP